MPNDKPFCPEPLALVFYSQGRLSEVNHEAVEAHLARCEACRELLALSAKLATEEPCPFCGDGSKLLDAIGPDGERFVQCLNCSAAGPCAMTPEDARTAWAMRRGK